MTAPTPPTSDVPAAPAAPAAEAFSPAVRRAALPVTTLVQAATSAAVIGPTVAAPLLLDRLQLGPAAVGVFVALVYAGAMYSAPLAAYAVRRQGPIRASQWALLVACGGLLLLWGAHALGQWTPAALGALLVGLGYGPITPASSQMLARTTAARHYALVFSIKQTGVPLGGVIAGLMVPPLAVWGGADAALAGLAGLCLLAAAGAQPLAPALDAGRVPGGRWPAAAQVLAPVGVVWRHRLLRPLALVSFGFSMVQVSLTSYLVSLLTGDLRWGLAAAGATLAVAQVAGVSGRILWGWLADRGLGARRVLLGLAAGMGAAALATAQLGPASAPGLVSAVLAVFGATAVGWNGVYLATVARLVPPGEAATATAGTLFFTFFGVVLGPPLFGGVAQALGGLAPAFAALALPAACSGWLLWRVRWP